MCSLRAAECVVLRAYTHTRLASHALVTANVVARVGVFARRGTVPGM